MLKMFDNKKVFSFFLRAMLVPICTMYYGIDSILPEISSAVSILLSSTRPSPALANACAIKSAASVSPSAEMTAAFLCCSAISTRNLGAQEVEVLLLHSGRVVSPPYLAFSASCCATCLSSTACVNSLPKVQWVMEMSSRITPNCSARFVSS